MADFYGKETSKYLRNLRQNGARHVQGLPGIRQGSFQGRRDSEQDQRIDGDYGGACDAVPVVYRGARHRAKEKGCTDQEIAEAVWVAAAMRAGAAFSHGAIAMAVADEHKH